MSRTSDMRMRSAQVRQQLQSDIEKEFRKDIETEVNDTKSCLTEKLHIISKSIDQVVLILKEKDSEATDEIMTLLLSHKKQIKALLEDLGELQNGITKELLKGITNQTEQLEQIFTRALQEQSTSLKAFQTAHQEQVESLRQSFQESNLLQEELVQAASLKRTLSKSIYPLILLVCFLATCSIGAGFYLKSQKDHIAELHSQVETLRHQGGSLKLSNCDSRLCVQIDPKAPTYEGNYRIVAEK